MLAAMATALIGGANKIHARFSFLVHEVRGVMDITLICGPTLLGGCVSYLWMRKWKRADSSSRRAVIPSDSSRSTAD